MAIKLLGVEGTKILPGRSSEQAQDFVLADDETFPSGSPIALILLNRLLSGRGLRKMLTGARLLFFHTRVLLRSLRMVKRPSSLLDTGYFSAIPYKLGDHAVKYVVAPRERSDPGTGVDTRDGLGKELRARIEDKAAKIVFDFGVDIRTDAKTQPIEDPSIAWHSVTNSRREWLAEIMIPGQDIAWTGGLAENLAFSPWHAGTKHRPLGLLAEARREVYQNLARHRHQRNWIAPTQSSEAPAGYADGQPRTFGSSYWNAPPLNRRERLKKALKERAGVIARGFPFLTRLIDRIGPLQRASNWATIDYFASHTAHRPLPLSLWKRYPVKPDDRGTYGARVSWPGLVERSYTGRHLPPIAEEVVADLPPLPLLQLLFERPLVPTLSPRSSALFCFFAQWLTDSFLRTHPDDRRRNTSTQELDLCQIYGLGEEATRFLRAEEGGRLKSRFKKGIGELPPFLVNGKTLAVKGQFARLAFDPVHAASWSGSGPPHGYASGLRDLLERSKDVKAILKNNDRWSMFYATGLERGNSTILYSALNTLFLREHNRLARELQRRYSTKDDDWLFETARNINIVKYLKIIVEDYINHLVGSDFKLRFTQGLADRRTWYRANRITIEFNLLYRWHALVPDEFRLGGRPLPQRDFRYNNILVEQYGIEALFDAASRQPAGHIQLHNTPSFLVPADLGSVAFARQFRLAGFNAYRKRWGLKPYETFYELTGDWPLAFELAGLYPDRNGIRGIDRVELPVGLYAEQRDSEERALPVLLSLMVASDAFSHALTNPLLAANVYGRDGLTDFGFEEIEGFGREPPGWLGGARGVATLQQLLWDNCLPSRRGARMCFDLPGPA